MMIYRGLCILLLFTSGAFCALPSTKSLSETTIHIITLDNKPAANVLTIFVPAGRLVDLLGTHEVDDDPSYIRQRTDMHGEAHFALPDDPSVIMAIDDSGYARASVSAVRANPTLHLLPWSKLQGQYTLGDKPAPNIMIYISLDTTAEPEGTPGLRLSLGDKSDLGLIKTDATGHFTAYPVPPGQFTMARHLTWHYAGGSAGGIEHAHHVTLLSGQTTTLRLGGDGRAVTGKFVFPAVLGDRATIELGFCRAYYNEKPFPVPMPPGIAAAPLARQQAWYAEFISSDAGRAYLAEKNRRGEQFCQFPVDVALDDSFRIDNVLPGRYTLSAGAWRKKTDGQSYDQIGDVGFEFDVPSDGASPVSLGPIDVKPPTDDVHLRDGDTAPDFSLPSLDGEQIRLSSYHGKFVLLDFWATWCGPCVAEMPNLKKLYADTSGDNRLVMISISVDENPFLPKQFVLKHGDDWLQVFGENVDTSPVAKRYGVGGIPAIFLVGPDGKIVARGLRGDDIAKRVNAVLSKPANR